MHWLANSGFLIFVPVPMTEPRPMPSSNYGNNFAAQQKTWILVMLHQSSTKNVAMQQKLY
jgi:hypothetical protein